MPACGYEFYLLVFNSTSHSFAALTREISSSTLEDKIHIHARSCNILYISCLLLPAHYCYDRYFFSSDISFRARITSRTRFICCWQRVRSIFLFEPVLRAARAFYRKHFWCFPTFRTKNTHIYLVCFTYIMFSSSKNYKSHSTVLQSCLLLT